MTKWGKSPHLQLIDMRRAERQYPGGRFAPTLRIGTHNINGIRSGTRLAGTRWSKLHTLFKTWWCDLGLDIVCIQETKIARNDNAAIAEVVRVLDAAAKEIGVPGYKVQWGSAETANAGVAVLIRKNLLASGKLKAHSMVLPTQAIGLMKSGRMLGLRCSWAGHTFNLVSVYLPSSDPSGQSEFINTGIKELVHQAHASHLRLVIAGDFNFTSDWRQDRIPAERAWETGRHADDGPSAKMAALCHPTLQQGLIDAFRLKHPLRKEFTYHNRAAASRIDRVYVSEGLSPYVQQCRATNIACSDHRPVTLCLSPAVAETTGKGIMRARMRFWADAQLRDQCLTWLHLRAREAPTQNPEQLLAWWPGFKVEALQKLLDLDRRYQQGRKQCSQQLQAARRRVQVAVSAVERGGSHAEALGELVEARRELAKHDAAAAIPEEVLRRQRWIKEGEKPSPVLTQLVKPPAAAKCVASLRCESGGLVTHGPQIAAMMAKAFAKISAGAQRDLHAETQVVAAVHKHARKLASDDAALAGQATVSVDEVKKAASAARPGTAPGPDGLPVQLWRKAGPEVWALLAALFSAIGKLRSVPEGFLDGVVSPLPKQGDLTLPTNYRPITLLNTDYRLLTSTLASRFTPLLGVAVGEEQTAFLPGRRMADNIVLLQLLPGLLHANATPEAAASGLASKAIAAFLDFRKAYDSVCRPFLLKVMSATGASAGMCSWVNTLLSDTSACACVNGFVSEPEPYHAGVRQGCPLAPALYLFVAWALVCWLKDCPSLGVQVAPDLCLTVIQYADDTVPFLRSLEEAVVANFVDHMAVFGRASGQLLNTAKCKLLPLGLNPGQPHGVVSGIPVVSEADALGATFTNTTSPTSSLNWAEDLEAVEHKFDKISRLQLSTFGRAQAAAAYGTSMLLSKLEHHDIPAEVADQLQSWTVGLVDRGKVGRGLPGVRSELLPGRPATGGFGMMPWREHCIGRWAMLARRYMVSMAADPKALLGRRQRKAEAGSLWKVPPPTPTWVPAAAHVLRHLHPSTPPVLGLLQELSGPHVPGPISRMARGLQALGPTAPLSANTLHFPAFHCRSIPLWGNPFLQFELTLSQRTCRWPQPQPPPAAIRGPQCGWARAIQSHQGQDLSFMRSVPGLHTVQDLLVLTCAVLRWHQQAALPGGLPYARGPGRRQAFCSMIFGQHVPPGTLPTRVERGIMFWAPPPIAPDLLLVVLAMHEAIPVTWRNAVYADSLPVHLDLASTPPWTRGGVTQGEAAIVASMKWKLPWGQDTFLVPTEGELSMSVRMATTLQLKPSFESRQVARIAYAKYALHRESQDTCNEEQVEQAAMQVTESLKRLWAIPWDNKRKETLWRLITNGIAGAGGHDICLPGPCPCGYQGPAITLEQHQKALDWRGHYFWGCVVAKRVVEEIAACLPATTPVTCASIWLMVAPPFVHKEVWEVVCMVAVEAMALGRRRLWAGHLEAEEEVDATQPLITDFFLPLAPATLMAQPSPADEAGRFAVGHFWSMLDDFVSVVDPPPNWSSVGPNHPLMSFQSSKLVLKLPPHRALPPHLD